MLYSRMGARDWLKHCATSRTSRKDVGSSTGDVIGIFIEIILPVTHVSRVDSAFSRSEYQEY